MGSFLYLSSDFNFTVIIVHSTTETLALKKKKPPPTIWPSQKNSLWVYI